VRRTKPLALLLSITAALAVGTEAHATIAPSELPPAAVVAKPIPEPDETPSAALAAKPIPEPDEPGARTTAPPRPKTVTLTFDDGPSEWTPQILAILKRHHITATFCMVGTEAARYPAYARQVVAEGHELCNHSQDHADLAKISPSKCRREVIDAERSIRDAAGVSPRFFRFPYGSSNRTARALVDGYGMRELDWDVDPLDWTRPPATTITARVLAQAKPDAIVLMHDGGGDRSHTAASLDATIAGLQRRGYTFRQP
jgi:peptidoglycan/xylan/chitin deacetylase (PgdA/CDA1 family)